MKKYIEGLWVVGIEFGCIPLHCIGKKSEGRKRKERNHQNTKDQSEGWLMVLRSIRFSNSIRTLLFEKGLRAINFS